MLTSQRQQNRRGRTVMRDVHALDPDDVIARFDIPDRCRDVIMQMMGAAWRQWRTEIKAKSYDPNTPLDELVSIRSVPQKLTPEVWETLCHYWKLMR
ncbi:hypothetical protein ZIOFF_034251 [Zingiber officinale]|uniref:Uncharacterized protein n=1 Tax=Zingiber officinale TaxID=94328 RepID=A0A8J5H3H5_ZINOF|nr:hypothetical protein ZIOFF_034251 [Zingiber officinale]